jgi:hypothetical protein
VVFCTTSALAPGYYAVTVTVGGTTSGYWEIGSVNMESVPTRRIRIAITEDKIGRVMKVWSITLDFGFGEF